MGKDVRLWLAVIFGSLILCNQCEAKQHTHRHHHQASAQQPATPAPDLKPDNLKQACDQDDQRHDAGICASLRQAEAAEQANRISANALAWNEGGIVAIVFTLFVTTWAAYASTKAALAAQNLINASERPYLIVEVLGTNLGDFPPPEPAYVEFEIRNVGGSVAIIDHIWSSLAPSGVISQARQRYLGGSNVFFIEKGSPRKFDAHSSESALEIYRNLPSVPLILTVNFSYQDRFKKRRDFYSESRFYGPNHGFNYGRPPVVEDVKFDKYRWHRWKNNLHVFRMNAQMFLLGMPQKWLDGYPPNHPDRNQDRSPGWLRWIRAGYKRPPPRWEQPVQNHDNT